MFMGYSWGFPIKYYWVVENAFGGYIFGSFRNKANIITQYYLVPHWLSANSKTDDTK